MLVRVRVYEGGADAVGAVQCSAVQCGAVLRCVDSSWSEGEHLRLTGLLVLPETHVTVMEAVWSVSSPHLRSPGPALLWMRTT